MQAIPRGPLTVHRVRVRPAKPALSPAQQTGQRRCAVVAAVSRGGQQLARALGHVLVQALKLREALLQGMAALKGRRTASSGKGRGIITLRGATMRGSTYSAGSSCNSCTLGARHGSAAFK